MLDWISTDKEIEMGELSEDLKALPLHSLLAAACITYLSSAPEDSRRSLLRRWQEVLGVDQFSLTSFLGSEKEQLQWLSEGLPSDELSVHNALIILKVILCLAICPQRSNRTAGNTVSCYMSTMLSSYCSTVLLHAIVPLSVVLLHAIVPLSVVLLRAIVPLIVVLLHAIVPLSNVLLHAIVPLSTVLLHAIVPLSVVLLHAIIPLSVVLLHAIVPLSVVLLHAIVPLSTVLLHAIVPLNIVLLHAVVPLSVVLLHAIVPLSVVVVLLRAIVPLSVVLFHAIVPLSVVLLRAIVPLSVVLLRAIVPLSVVLLHAIVPLSTVLLHAIVPLSTAPTNNAPCCQASLRPFLVDPSSLASDWLKKHLSGDSNVEVISQHSQRFTTTLELAIRYTPSSVKLDANVPGRSKLPDSGQLAAESTHTNLTQRLSYRRSAGLRLEDQGFEMCSPSWLPPCLGDAPDRVLLVATVLTRGCS
uniref:Uncharacterized protein n=1 Tax=Timema genevievae TaxID=629358 RepID=A0A7R9JZG2_TIMGE|nr:unnamed protein product [Timema genevievae]